LTDRGNQADYVLGTAEGWDAFSVVRWHAIEEISAPYRYEITVTRDVTRGAVDLDALLDTGASFRISSRHRWRVVHGVLAEAEEIDRTANIILYRFLLVPSVWRARFRRRCRTFVGRTLKEIVSFVLENRLPTGAPGIYGIAALDHAPVAPDTTPSFASFKPPTSVYRWNVLNEQRITDATVYPFVVHYNESDFAFVSRLLEHEGLSYYFEQEASGEVMTITDAPGQEPLFATDETFTMRRINRGMVHDEQEIVRALRDARRMQSHAVTMRAYDYNRSLSTLEGTASDGVGDPQRDGDYGYPADEEAVQDTPGLHAAQVRMERHSVEQRMREGYSTVRTMEPGHRCTVHDADNQNPDQQILVVRVETYATEVTPRGTLLDEEPFGFAQAPGAPTHGYDNRFLALPAELAFRPAELTPRPRIHGVQTAHITAEEFAGPAENRPKINADPLSRVRIRFPWDQRPDLDNGTPSSDWVRVSQFWAGAGYGALYTPRVGHEVLVAFLQGDPDRPVVVGRVYNPQMPPPYDLSQEPTKSTLKSQSAQETQEVDGFNELRFDDKAKQEEVYLHAQRNLNETVLADHSTSVGGNQSNSVGGDQTNSVKGHREHTVSDYETVTVGDDRTTNLQANEHHHVAGFRDASVGANEKLTVGGFRGTTIGANETLTVGGFRLTTIADNDDHHVGGWHNVLVGASETQKVGGKRDVTIGAGYNVNVGADYASVAVGNHGFKSPTTTFENGTSFEIKAGSASLSMSSGVVTITNGAGASLALIGGNIYVLAGAVFNIQSGSVSLNSTGEVDLNAGGDMNGKAPAIHWNG
jgi:type VI secretion system secreted protein VgrG